MNSLHFAASMSRSVIQNTASKYNCLFLQLPSKLYDFVGFIFICFSFSRYSWRHILFIEKKIHILFQNIWNKKHRCWIFIKTWMCKAHVLMQSSPFRWEESKPIALFFYSSFIHRKYTFPQIIRLFEALREMFSVTISFSQKMLAIFV